MLYYNKQQTYWFRLILVNLFVYIILKISIKL